MASSLVAICLFAVIRQTIKFALFLRQLAAKHLGYVK
jgi:hypothetical protein